MTFKILLINPFSPTSNVFSLVSGATPPLGLAYIAGYLEKQFQYVPGDVEIKIWDLEVQLGIRRNFRKEINDFGPDVVGFTVVTLKLPVIKILSRIVKQVNSRVHVVVGGPHPTVDPYKTMESEITFDFLVCGEGEVTFHELVSHLKDGLNDFGQIPGLYFRSPEDPRKIFFSGEREPVKDLSLFNPPARHLLDYKLYLKEPQSPGIWKKTANVFTQRGCPYNCSFCSAHVIHKNKVRFAPVDAVIGEIKKLKKEYSIDHVNFRDSNFTLNRDRCIEICKRMIQEGLDVTWNCETRVNLVDKTLLELMRLSGCVKISFGVESGSEKILREIDKQISVESVKRAFSLCKDARIDTQAFFMVGFPDESMDDILDTWNLITTIKPDFLFISVVVPLPGTKIYDQTVSGDLFIRENDYSSFQFFYSSPSWKTRHFEVETLVRIQKELYRKYVFRLKYILKMIMKIRTFSQMHYYFSAFLGFFNFFIKR
ncbi:MAG: B12-binding domain-containing radical SAM protein [Promethearchaeota archaeon]